MPSRRAYGDASGKRVPDESADDYTTPGAAWSERCPHEALVATTYRVRYSAIARWCSAGRPPIIGSDESHDRTAANEDTRETNAEVLHSVTAVAQHGTHCGGRSGIEAEAKGAGRDRDALAAGTQHLGQAK